ncbi:MAG: hypothetical protein CMM18_05410 [Rhodospirillaceae bacterium]|nr:hypothetical protein [Rhodospirillaceae bacterium]|tara:strand:- start:26 stop:724 length:699 start_codon:yes stop_codon:yes gene_type:complete
MNDKKNILLCLGNEVLESEIQTLINQTENFNAQILHDEDKFQEVFKDEKYDCLIGDSSVIDLIALIDTKYFVKYDFKIPVYLISGNEISISDKVFSNFIFYRIKIPIVFKEFIISINNNFQILLNKKNKKVFIGNLIFFPHLKIIIYKDNLDKVIKLTDKESAIIEYLSMEENFLVPKNVLLKEVWGYNKSIDTHTLETHIYKIRKKIEIDYKKPVYLTNEEGGYKLNFSLV